MILHLLKLVWNRKKANLLIIIEIFAAFLVLVVTLTAGIYFVQLYRQPLGYEWQDVWRVSIDVGQSSDDKWSDEMVSRFRLMLDEVGRMPEIESVAGIQYPPYGDGASEYSAPGKPKVFAIEVTDDVFEVLKVPFVAGRPFNEDDDALSRVPVVLDRDLARAAFGSENPIGQTFDPTTAGSTAEGRYRVVGVVEDFRKSGELEPKRNMMLIRTRVGDVSSRPPRNLVLRLAPGSGAFEEELVSRLAQIAPDWSFSVQPLERGRDASLRLRLAPLLVGLVIAGFLVMMVGLGLTGILWQSVTRRTSEIGLRRAVGASAGKIHAQVLLEVLILITLSIILGIVLVAQVPILGWMSFLGPTAIPLGIGAAAVLIYATGAICALYPSALAARIEPAEALHYE